MEISPVIRYLISDQIEGWLDYNAFRCMDSTNYKLFTNTQVVQKRFGLNSEKEEVITRVRRRISSGLLTFLFDEASLLEQLASGPANSLAIKSKSEWEIFTGKATCFALTEQLFHRDTRFRGHPYTADVLPGQEELEEELDGRTKPYFMDPEWWHETKPVQQFWWNYEAIRDICQPDKGGVDFEIDLINYDNCVWNPMCFFLKREMGCLSREFAGLAWDEDTEKLQKLASNVKGLYEVEGVYGGSIQDMETLYLQLNSNTRVQWDDPGETEGWEWNF
ncbi:hypothetical protein BJ508DRAFT_323771 [Ascobolus immersus RN42]|uniref:Uncharacterized protein n=1 Tax=Ascobolus immersus RN42 TaxID=1160509 RepID=A0A3N4IRB4_ASCIM|nr:hypothetical protein BJ508DRAFT_323771 [Ascobolus immersus RN42]